METAAYEKMDIRSAIESLIKTERSATAGSLLTTITDMGGFFFALSFASFLLPRLSG